MPTRQHLSCPLNRKTRQNRQNSGKNTKQLLFWHSTQRKQIEKENTMKLRIENFTTLLMVVVILFASCDGDKQKPPEQVEVSADTPIEITLSEKAQSETVPTTLYPPENPYKNRTATGTAPPDGYRGYSTFWIPEFEYELESGIAEKYAVSLPIAPNHAEKMARFEQREKEFYETVEKNSKTSHQKNLCGRLSKKIG